MVRLSRWLGMTATAPRARIVVIDDNADDFTLIRRVLERAGFEVHYASNGESGIELLREIQPDCALVDYRMPGLDGYEVCRRVKAEPALQSIPVLMLTGEDSSENLVQGLEAGADDFVTKSSEIEVILARVRALLRVKAFQDRIVDQSEQLRRLYDELSQKTERILALNQRLNSDLQFARTVQEALLPAREFVSPAAEIRSVYIPSETLSGDFYDYFDDEKCLYLFLADVSGHGLAAAILVSLLKSFLHSELKESRALSEFMERLNDFLFTASLPSQFATAQLFEYDIASRMLSFSNAAHPPFLLYSQEEKRTKQFEVPGHLLGAMPGMPFDSAQARVGQGDLLFCYTDGLTDRRNKEGVFYGLERIEEILTLRNSEDLTVIYDEIYRDVTAFSPTEEFRDDLAFIVTRFP